MTHTYISRRLTYLMDLGNGRIEDSDLKIA